MKYLIFRRSARNFEEFATARKKKIRSVDTIEEARKICSEFNDNRTNEQIKAGTKLEFQLI